MYPHVVLRHVIRHIIGSDALFDVAVLASLRWWNWHKQFPWELNQHTNTQIKPSKYICIICLGAPKRKRRNARSGSHDTIAGPERNWKGWCFGVMINTYAFTGPRKTHPQVGQYVFPIFHCKGVGCVYISSENAFDKSALLVDRNKLKIQVKTNSSTNYYYYYYYY